MLDVVQNKPLGNSEISIQITVLTDLEQRSKVCINKLHRKRQHVSETHFVTSTTTMWANTPAGIYLLKVNNRNTRVICETCSKLPMKMCFYSGVFIFNFKHIPMSRFQKQIYQSACLR